MKIPTRMFARSVLLALIFAPFAIAGNVAASTTQKRVKLVGTINVSAASSLTAAFTQIGAKFHKLYPYTMVNFNFGSSTTLATQILAGAPADIFASADLTDMDTLVIAGAVRVAPKIFARNTLMIAVKPNNPLHITGLSSLSSAGVVAECAASAPCGIYAAIVLKRAGVTIAATNVDRTQYSTATVDQVSYGDANAAIVYVTDVKGQGALVSGVKIPLQQNTIADYPIARLTRTHNVHLAGAFVAFVESKAGQRSLAAQKFLAP